MSVKVCVPVTGRTEAEILRQAQEIADTAADLVEWRADYCPQLFLEPSLTALLQALGKTLGEKELLFTIRTEAQGGQWQYCAPVYEEVLLCALRSGCIQYVDVEACAEPESLARLVKAAAAYGVRSIVSHHDFAGTPALEQLLAKFADLRESGAEILKTAYMPHSPADVARLLLAAAQFREADGGAHELIFMSMGALGKISRIGAGAFGSLVTFASVCEASAPGQLPIDAVKRCLEVLE